MSKPLVCLLFCLGLIGCSSTTPPPGAPSAEAKTPSSTPAPSPAPELAKAGPPATADSIADGKKLYSAGDCAICHGKRGDGKGFLAKDISMNLHDWRTSSAQANFTDAQLFDLIDKGKGTGRGRMPAYHDTDSPEQIWHMVNYIRSFASAAPAQQPNG